MEDLLAEFPQATPNYCFRNINKLIYGNYKNLWINSEECEKHVDRSMNVWGSGGAHHTYFKKVDNDKHLNPKEAKHAFTSLVKKYANKWVNSPIKNSIGQRWIKDQLKLRKAGLK